MVFRRQGRKLSEQILNRLDYSINQRLGRTTATAGNLVRARISWESAQGILTKWQGCVSFCAIDWWRYDRIRFCSGFWDAA